MLDDTEDDQLALAAAAGDAAAFARLLARIYPRIHSLAWRFSGGPPDSEDLTQDICATLGRKIRSFRAEARFGTWLYRVILNAARDRYRRRDAHTQAVARFVEVDGMRRADASSDADRATWLREAIAALPPDLRETAVLVLDEGLTHAEAADVLGLQGSTVSWRLMTVRKLLTNRAREEGLRT